MTKIKNFFKKLGMIAFKSVFAVLMGVVLLSSFIVFALPVSILAGIDFVCQKFENKTTSKPKLEDIEIDSVKLTEQIEEKQDENELVQEKIKSDRSLIKQMVKDRKTATKNEKKKSNLQQSVELENDIDISL